MAVPLAKIARNDAACVGSPAQVAPFVLVGSAAFRKRVGFSILSDREMV